MRIPKNLVFPHILSYCLFGTSRCSPSMPGVRCCRLFIRTQHRIRYSHSAAHSRPAQKYGSTHIYTFASIFASGTIASLLWARWRSPLRLDERTRDIKSGKVAIPQDERFISAEELAKHTTPDSLWVVVDQRVWESVILCLKF